MKKYFIAFCFLFSSAYCFTQDFGAPTPAPQHPADTNKTKGPTPFWSKDKIYTGGGLGLSFGTITFINLSPIIGYKITPKYSAGIGITYIYIKDNRNTSPYSLNIFGGSVFTRYLITQFFFAHAEYEVLEGNWDPYYSSNRFLMENVWVGGGLRQHSGNSSVNIMALWNLTETPYSRAFFGNPQLRIGIGIGL